MDKATFGAYFRSALDAAADYAESKLGKPVPRQFEIEYQGPPYKGEVKVLGVAEAIAVMYLGPELSYRVIDIAALEITSGRTRILVRVSGHPPAPYSDTWNDPPGFGPFKQIHAVHIPYESGAA